MNSSKRNILSGLAWGTIGRFTAAILKFFSVPLLLNHFGENDYGLIVLAISINVYLQIMELGLNTGNIRFISHWLAKKEMDKVIKLIQSSVLFYGGVGILNAIILIGLSFYSKNLFELTTESSELFRKLLYILSLTALISWCLSVSSHVLRAYEKVDFDERLNFYSNIVAFMAVLVTIELNLTLSQYFFLYALAILAPFPLRIIKIKKINPEISFLPAWHKDIFKEVFRYGLGIFSMGIFQFSVRNLRPIILGIQATLVSVTEFKIIDQIAALVVMLSGSFLSVFLPFATKIKSQKNIAAQQNLAYNATRYLSVFLVLLIFGLVLISEPLLEIYVGSNYKHLSIWLNIWALTLLGNHNYAISALVLADSNIKPLAFFTMFSSVLSLAVAWFLAPIFEVGGVVTAFLLYTVLQLLFYYVYYIPKVMNFNALEIFIKSFLYPVSIGVSAYLLSFLLMHYLNITNAYWYIGIAGGSFTLIYIASTLLTTLKPGEIKSLIR